MIVISSPTGGYGTFEYSNNGGATWQVSGTFSSLAPGSYDVRIRDRAHTGCVIVLDPALVISEPAQFFCNCYHNDDNLHRSK